MNELFKKMSGVLNNMMRFAPVAFIVQFVRRYKIAPKIICLLLSLMFWFYVDSKRLAESHFKIPVRIEMSHDYAVSEIEKRYVSVVARGSSDDLRNVAQNNIVTYVKIQNPDLSGAARYPVTVVGSDVPETVTFIPEDKTIFVKVEKRISKRIKVVVDIDDDVDSDYFAGNPRITPDEVEISGAESIVKKINDISTEPISLSGKRSSFEEQYRLSDQNLKNCELSQKFIDVYFPVYSVKDVTRVTAELVLKNQSDKLSYIYSSHKVQVLVRTDKSDAGIDADDLDVWVDLNEGRIVMPKDNAEVVEGTFTVHAKSRSQRQIETVVPERITIKARKR